MSGIPPELFTPLREALLASGAFDGDDRLAPVFAHALLVPWRDRLPEARSRADRAEAVMAYLVSKRYAGTGQNALVILLQVLRERINPHDETYSTLTRLSDQLAQALVTQATDEGIPDAPNAAAIQAWLDGSHFDEAFAALIEDRTRDFTGRAWVFNAVGTWLAQTPGGVFLLAGDPGTGKTAVAARLAQFSAGAVVPPEGMSLPESPFLAAVHFCSTRLSDTLDPRLVAGSLAGQLADRYPAFRQALFAGAPNPGDLHSAQEWWHTFLRKPLAALDGTPITILIDSLDEGAHHEGRETVVDLLAGSAGWPGARWVLTTRDEAGIPRRFAVQPFDLIKDARRDVHEVRAYAAARLAGELPPEILSPEERADLATRLAQPDQGNFLYARYMLDDLVSRLRAGEAPDLAHLPPSLNALYAEFLGRVVEPESTEWPDRYRPLLGAVAVSQGEGLDRDTLAAVIGLPRQAVSDSLRSLHAYIVAPTPTGPYHLYHQSFGDFLLHEADNPDFWIDSAVAHRRLADWGLAAGAKGWEQAQPYAVRYTPAHMLAALEAGDGSAGDPLVTLLTDLGYLAARLVLDAGNTWLLEQEFTRAATTPLDDTGRFLMQAYDTALRMESYALRSHPGGLYPQLYNRLWRGDAGLVDQRLKASGGVPQTPWLRTCRPLPVDDLRLRRVLIGHTSSVLTVDMTIDGRIVVSGGADGTVRVWDGATGQELLVLEGHVGRVEAVAVTADGRRVVSGGADGTVRVWDGATGQELLVLTGNGRVAAMAVTADGGRVLSGGNDGTVGTVRVWDGVTGQEQLMLTCTMAVWAVAVTADGQRVVAGEQHGTVRVWDGTTGQELRVLMGHTGTALAVAMTPNGGRIVSGGGEGAVQVWDGVTGRGLQELEGHTGWEREVWVPYGSKGAVYEGEEEWVLEEDEGWVRAVDVTADGRRVVWGGDNGTVRIWDLTADREAEPLVLTGHMGEVEAVAVTVDGRRVVSGGADHTVRIWDLASDPLGVTLKNASWSVSAWAVTPDQRLVVSGGTDGTVRVWDGVTGQELLVMERRHRGAVHTIAVTPDGRRIVSGGEDEIVRVWNVATGKLRLDSWDRVNAVAITANGWWVIEGGVDGVVLLRAMSSQYELGILTGHIGEVRAVAVTPDRGLAVSGGDDGTVRLWNLTPSGPELPLVLQGHIGPVLAVAVTPDERLVVSGGDDQTVRVWDRSTGQELLVLTGHTSRVRAIGVTADGRRVVSCGDDRTVRVWDGVTGVELAHYIADAPLIFCAISSDGRAIQAGKGGGPMLTFTVEE